MREEGSVNYLRRSEDLILFVAGEVTAPLAQSMFSHLAAELDPPSFARIFAEMSRTTYIDSTMIGTLIKLKKLLAPHNGSLILCNPSEKVKRILSDMHLLAYFSVANAEALQDIRTEVLTEIPADHKDLLRAEYLLDAHKAIVSEAPHLTKEFEALISALRIQTATDSSQQDTKE
jgi:anti-anti-sigma factor